VNFLNSLYSNKMSKLIKFDFANLLESDLWNLLHFSHNMDRFDDAMEILDVLLQRGPIPKSNTNLICVTFKTALNKHRDSIRYLKYAEKQLKKGSTALLDQESLSNCLMYQKKVFKELEGIIIRALSAAELLLEHCNEEELEFKLIYIKMIADYHRYGAEYSEGEIRENYVRHSKESYEKAHTKAAKFLSPFNECRLGIALNYAVFVYEILDDVEKALEIATNAKDAGLKAMKNQNESINLVETTNENNSKIILQFLNDNVVAWQNLKDNEFEKTDQIEREDSAENENSKDDLQKNEEK